MIDMGTVDNAIELVFTQGNSDNRYVLQEKFLIGSLPWSGEYSYAEDHSAFLRRFPTVQVKRTNDHYIDDTDGQWFACYNVDCFDPPFAVIRARSWESAYGVFCSKFERWLRVDESDAADYPEDDREYNDNGTHIDASHVQIHALTLVSVTCSTGDAF